MADLEGGGPGVSDLLVALERLERAATEVARYGAQTGPQWPVLTVALLYARSAIANVRASEAKLKPNGE